MLLEGLRVGVIQKNDWHGEVLTNMKVLHSIPKTSGREGTKLTVVAVPSSPFNLLLVFEVPTAPIVITHFQQMGSKMVAPFRGSFAGVVCDLGPTDITQQGQPKKSFNLVDSFGAWFPCVGIGRHAENPQMQHGQKVIFYFGTARPSTGANGAAVFAFKDAMIVPLGVQNHIIAKRVQINLE